MGRGCGGFRERLDDGCTTRLQLSRLSFRRFCEGRDVREAVVGDVAAAEAEGLEGRHARRGPRGRCP